ncbi:MAG: HRDC domain-containing protein [Pirellulaceae bacterium]|nr:HRDC domain-containing protein [Pirellulaceae bacterium]
MGLRFFTIPIQDSAATQAELNGFLSSHKVLAIDRRWVDLGTNSFWAICVDYLASATISGDHQPALSRNRIDYKSILPADEFEVFSRLRDLRKEMAQAEAVPVYALFTNEQLAQMVQRRCRDKSELSAIEGVGDAKVEKYAERLLPVLAVLEERADASRGEPV